MKRIEFRSSPTLKGNTIGGLAVVFDQVTDLGYGKEAIAAGSLDAALSRDDADVRALYNHDPLYVLGRQSAGTLRLTPTTAGLEYEIDLPDTGYGRDLAELVRRGDITGASFAFLPGQVETRGGVTVHTSISRLVDVSPVTYPAYPGATTETRSARPAMDRRTQLARARLRVLMKGIR